MTIVATRSGKVEGFERDGVQVFQGIPYAAPPIGARRWQAPQREESWAGTRPATSFSAQSAQTEFAMTKMMGGARVGTLLGTPAARGLFTAAIPQSGAASWVADTERATRVAEPILANLGVRAGDVDALLAVSTDDVLNAIPAWREDGVNALPFQPVIDGIVLREAPLAAIGGGNAAGVRVLTGTNLTEMTLFTVADPNVGAIDDDGIRKRLWSTFGDAGDAMLESYRSRRPNMRPADLWQEIATDAVFRIPAIRLLEAQLPHAAVWSYLFTFETPVFGGILRPPHALEIPFAFDNLDRGAAEFLTGRGPGL